MKVALVHDYLNQMGGAERVVMAFHEIFPDAPIYTSIYDPQRVDPAFQKWIFAPLSCRSFLWLPNITSHTSPSTHLPWRAWICAAMILS